MNFVKNTMEVVFLRFFFLSRILNFNHICRRSGLIFVVALGILLRDVNNSGCAVLLRTDAIGLIPQQHS